jgi:hypothetical protein
MMTHTLRDFMDNLLIFMVNQAMSVSCVKFEKVEDDGKKTT